MNPGDLVVKTEFHIGLVSSAGDRGCIDGIRCAGKRYVALAGEETGCRIDADPACARQVDLCPGMQVREVMIRAGRPIEGFLVRFELYEVTRNEPRCEAEMPQDLYQ